MKNTALTLRRQDPTPDRRPLAPRQSLYDNQLHGRGDEEDAAGKLRRTAAVAYAPQAEVLDSPLWGRLYHGGKALNGTWMPTWIVRVTATEARARVLTETLWRFEVSFKDVRQAEAYPKAGRTPRARAKVYDADGLQWFGVSVRQLAGRTMLPPRTVADAINELAARNLIYVTEIDGRRCLRPNGPALARAYYDDTGDAVAFAEFLDAESSDCRADWTGSTTQQRAYHTSRGVTVHNALVPVLELAGVRRRNTPFLARLLSQFIFKFGDKDGRCRATRIRYGNRWWLQGHDSLAAELGVSKDSVKRGIKALVGANLLLQLPDVFRTNSAGQARLITCLRPNVDVLDAKVGAVLASPTDDFDTQGEKAHEPEAPQAADEFVHDDFA